MIRTVWNLVLSLMAFASALVLLPERVHAETSGDVDAQQAKAEQTIEALNAPLYSPFTERYLLDEVKTLRQMLADHRVEVTEKMTDRELEVADKALMYATDTVTYFFYLIAGASTLLVLIGWNSLREIKERASALANDEIQRITSSYEERLEKLERELHSKSRHIAATQEEIELTNEVHSLWLKASQESSAQNKIAIYDQILGLRPEDVEAITYKADAALSLGQAQWANALANRALTIDPENSHAKYQRACAHAESGYIEEALRDLSEAIETSEALREQAAHDPSFERLRELDEFISMTQVDS
ncbi:TPR end-of-group domain-containing protein [Thalassolituus maritimus]|uniref:Tetratricopeptide repeat-containing protein n=1 Tax=Thalassolituus maritimus TaxID=484498 RepID=A0ABP9ZX45_9GAMM